MRPNQPHAVTEETIDQIFTIWRNTETVLKWDCPFVLPVWLNAWHRTFFIPEYVPYICSVRQHGELLGIAPLMIQGETASLMGDTEVCDYLDFIVSPGREKAFFNTLIPHLKSQGITCMDLRALRPDATVLTYFNDKGKTVEGELSCCPDGVTFETNLPATWNEFLFGLTGKQRHEIRRKFRRLHEAASVRFRVVEGKEHVEGEMRTFLALFWMNRQDKAAFMSDRMVDFFQSLAKAMAEVGLLKLFFLEIEETPAAGVMCFDYQSTIYLYNNGFDNRYRSLSVGLLSKVLTIKDSIHRGRTKYDFLKGDEKYKKQLGATPLPLCRCRFKI